MQARDLVSQISFGPSSKSWSMWCFSPPGVSRSHGDRWKNPPFSIGNTSTQMMVHFPASYVIVSLPEGMHWIWPPPSNSGKWRFRVGFPTKNVIILVVTVTGRGPHPRYATKKHTILKHDSFWWCFNPMVENLKSWKRTIEPRKKKTAGYGFHWNPGCLIGILVSWFMKSSPHRQIVIPYPWTPKPWKMKVLGPQNMGPHNP